MFSSVRKRVENNIGGKIQLINFNLPNNSISFTIKHIQNNDKILENIEENRSDRQAFNTLPAFDLITTGFFHYYLQTYFLFQN